MEVRGERCEVASVCVGSLPRRAWIVGRWTTRFDGVWGSLRIRSWRKGMGTSSPAIESKMVTSMRTRNTRGKRNPGEKKRFEDASIPDHALCF